MCLCMKSVSHLTPALLLKGDLKVAGLNVLFSDTSYLPLMGDWLV